MEASETGKIVYYDDSCKLCNSLVNTLKNYDSKAVFRFKPLRNTSFENLDTLVFQNEKEIYIKSKAVLEILRVVKKKKWLQILLKFLPKRFNDAIYDFIAKHRHRWYQTN